MRNELFGISEQEVGYLEKASNSQLDDKTANAGKANWTKYGEWYGQGKNGYAWCAMFVSWCAAMAGIPADIIPRYHSSTAGMNWFKSHQRWADKPTPGDIIFFGTDAKAVHTGIVRAVSQTTVYTIEGNTSGGFTLIANGGGVAKKSYPLTYAKIVGYGHPNYQEVLDMTIDEARKELTTVDGTGEAHSEWADEAVGTLIQAGVFGGDGQGNYGWGQCLTREGAAKVLYNLLERLGLLNQL